MGVGKKVAVMLRKNGDVHFLVDNVDLGPAGKVPMRPGLKYRLLVDVHSVGTHISLFP